MFFVYLIQSQNYPKEHYIGYTTDLKQRLHDHNEGFSKHTKKFMPWNLITYLAFNDKDKVRAFEYYLKTGSGKAFANKRLW